HPSSPSPEIRKFSTKHKQAPRRGNQEPCDHCGICLQVRVFCIIARHNRCNTRVCFGKALRAGFGRILRNGCWVRERSRSSCGEVGGGRKEEHEASKADEPHRWVFVSIVKRLRSLRSGVGSMPKQFIVGISRG